MGASEVFLLISLLVKLALAGRHDIYSGYSVHGVQLRDASDTRFLHSLESELKLDWWEYGAPGIRDALVLIPPENSAEFLDKLDSVGLTHYLHVADVAKELEERDTDIAKWRQSRGNRLVPFEDYPRYAEVDAYMERLAAQYPELVSIVNAGPSYEGRAVKYLKISTSNFTNTSKPIYFITAMLHAREWVTTPVTLYAIHRLVEDLRDGDRDLLDGTDWIVMPLVNPDGYEYSHTDERLWRRTRSFYHNENNCYGVDANRNFDVDWNTLGVSSDPCTNTYPGPEPFSEPEIGYIRDILLEYQGRIQVYLDVHSQGNLVLFAYGDGNLTSNAVHLHHVGSVMGAAIDTEKLPQASFYLVGNSALLLYATSGTSQDYGQLVGVPFPFTLELPGLGYGHSVPPQYIAQINRETWRGVAASARVSALHYRARQN